MADELNHRMDRQLREYAQARRREAAVGELHPATRRLLQSEVARVYGQARAARAPHRFGGSRLWFRVAVTAGGVAVLLLAGTVWLSLLARQRGSRPLPQLVAEAPQTVDRSLSSPTPQGRPLEAPSLAGAERLGAETRVKLQSGESAQAGQETFASGPMAGELVLPASKTAAVEGAALLPATDTARGEQVEVTPAVPAAAATATAASLGPQAVGRAEAEAIAKETSLRLGEQNVQRNVELDRRLALGRVVAESASETVAGVALSRGVGLNPEGAAVQLATSRDETAGATAAFFKNEASAPGRFPVLRTFRLVQTDGLVRLIDGDGSTYAGNLVQTAAPAVDSAGERALAFAEGQRPRATPGAAALQYSPLPGEAASGRQVHYFTARGTNLTLNQIVVVQGQFEAGVTPARAANGARPGGRVQSRVAFGAPAANATLLPPQVAVSLVQGQATIGGSNTILIRAVPVAP